jgi:hypothetical protein
LREVICPVLELREEKRTFVKIGGGKVDFFQTTICGIDIREPYRNRNGPSSDIWIEGRRQYMSE